MCYSRMLTNVSIRILFPFVIFLNMMKVVYLFVLIECVLSKAFIEKYLIIVDDRMDEKGFSQFSILYSTGKQYLYRLKSSYIDNDALILVDYPSKDTVGYLEGEWKNDLLNVTLEIFDDKLNEWINGTIKKSLNLLIENYLIKWNSKDFIMKKKLFSMNNQIYDQNKNLLAKFAKRFRWFNSTSIKYDLTIFKDNLPSAFYFFLVAIVDHRNIIQ